MTRCTYNLTEHNGADTPPRFYVNGIRVSRAKFDDIRERAYSTGRLDCFSTQARQMAGGTFRRTNRSVATFDY